MTTTLEDVEIDLPYPTYASDGLKGIVDVAEEYMQSSIFLFASGYDGGQQDDMIAWLAQNHLLSKEGHALTEDGAQKLDPGSSAMVDDYDKKRGTILDKT